MEKINFEDLPSTNTPINATNLNAIQTNVENAINSKGSYAYFTQQASHSMTNLTAWANHQADLNNVANFTTSGTDFTQNGNYIQCHFNGAVLIYRYIATDFTGEIDLIDSLGYATATGARQTSCMCIQTVEEGTNINFVFTGGMSGTMNVYSTRLIVVRLY